ncbi:hypothetical protein ACLHZ9_21665, partial [Aeromonas media]
WWRNGFAHDVMVPSWRDQARGNSGSRDDRLTFSCQCHLGEQLLSYYLMDWQRPHQHNDGMPPAEAENRTNQVSVFS